jgi:hypothetical protein
MRKVLDFIADRIEQESFYSDAGAPKDDVDDSALRKQWLKLEADMETEFPSIIALKSRDTVLTEFSVRLAVWIEAGQNLR